MHKFNIWKVFGFFSLYSFISLILYAITAKGHLHLLILIFLLIVYLENELILIVAFTYKTIKKKKDIFIPIKFFKRFAVIIIWLQLFLILFNISSDMGYSSYNFIQILNSKVSLSQYSVPIVPDNLIVIFYFIYGLYLCSFLGFLIRCPNNENGEIVIHKKKYDKKIQQKFIKKLKISLLFYAVIILFSILFQSFHLVSSKYMNNIFNTGDQILVERTSNLLNLPYKRGDIVAFYSDGELPIRRIIGLSGEKIKVTGDGRIFINNKQLSEPYSFNNHLLVPNKNSILGEITIPNNEYILVADNRATINKKNVGIIVRKNQIIGKVIYRYFPFNRAGYIK